MAVRIQTMVIGLGLIAVIMLISGCESSETVLVAPVIVEPTLTELPATATVVLPTATVAPTPVPNSPASYSVSHADRVYPELAELYAINLSFKQFGMEIVLTANIVGGPSSNRQMHCNGTTILWGNESGLTVKGDCLPYDDHPNFARSHRFQYTFENPGEAEIVFIYDNLPPASIIVQIDEDLVWPVATPNAPVSPYSQSKIPLHLLNNPVAQELADLYSLELHVVQNGSTVEVHGIITGGPDSHPEMHCRGIEVNWGNDVISVSTADCSPYKEGDKFSRGGSSFGRDNHVYQYTEAGYHEISYRYGELHAFPVVIYVDPD